MRLSADGKVQIFFSRENSRIDQDIWMRTSSDGGATWGPQTVVTRGGGDRRDGMPGVAPISDGRTLVCVFESLKDTIFEVHMATSTDNGATWSSRRTVYAAPPGLNAQSPQVVNAGGVLVSSFMTNEDTGNKDAAVKIVSSVDCGKSWGSKTTVAAAPQFWPGLVTTPFRSCLVVYGNGPQFVQKIQVGGMA